MIYTKLCKITKRGDFVKQMLQNTIAVYVHVDYKKGNLCKVCSILTISVIIIC